MWFVRSAPRGALAVGIAALGILPGGRAAPARPPLGDGEQLTYRVSWAILPVAGRIKVYGQAMTDPSGAPLFAVTTDTETRGLAKLFLPFEAHAQSLYDGRTGLLAWYGESSRTRNREAAHAMAFDLAHRQVLYTDKSKPGKPRLIALPPGDPMDLINTLLSARRWNLRIGQTRDILAFFEDDFYLLTVHAVGEEDVETSLGQFHAMILEPRMEKTPPKGMFRRGSSVRVWVAQNDPRRLPVQFQVMFKFGSGLATLTEYRPPSPEGAAGRPAPGVADPR
jgi:hypothetical protein